MSERIIDATDKAKKALDTVIETVVEAADAKLSWGPTAALAAFVGWHAAHISNEIMRVPGTTPQEKGTTSSERQYISTTHDPRNFDNLDQLVSFLKKSDVSKEGMGNILNGYVANTIAKLSTSEIQLSQSIVLSDLSFSLPFIATDKGVDPKTIGYLIAEIGRRMMPVSPALTHDSGPGNNDHSK